MQITAEDVYKAINRYNNGDRPYNFIKPRSWYLSDQGYIYPLKYIYALVINQETNSFHTSDAQRELGDLGFKIKEIKDFETEFLKDVEKSLNDTSENRRKRLAKAPKMPSFTIREVIVYKRNSDVVAEVLDKANGICQACRKPAPFNKRSNNKPYLEVHHRIHLANDGEDTVENAIAVCPNCHREAHYG